MDTKRCSYCHKLTKVDTEVCSRCGHAFVQKKPKVASRKPIGRSIPPASPHRAGHYSGLHPEDQPYQSSLIEVQQPVESVEEQEISLHRSGIAEPAGLILPTVEPPPVSPLPPLPPLPVPLPVPASDKTPLYNAPTIVERKPRSQPLAQPAPVPYVPRISRPQLQPQFAPLKTEKPGFHGRGRFIPIALTISCIFLLLASSITAFVLIHKKPAYNPQLYIVPTQLRANDVLNVSGSGFGVSDLILFTHDSGDPIMDGSGKNQLQARTDVTGSFSVHIVIPTNWPPGQHVIHANDDTQGIGASKPITILPFSSAPPLLQLSNASIDMGADAEGAITTRTITLINAGGQHLAWQASSDQPWLTLAPATGVFSGQAVTIVTVNRGTLAPLAYTGHILFTQQGSHNKPLSMTVKMSVKATSVSLSVAPVSLTYSGTPTLNPADQTITLQNTLNSPLDWNGTTATGDGSPWLSITPTSGHLDAHSSMAVTVSVRSQQLVIGSYQGTISLKGGSMMQVSVALNVVAADTLIASPPSLTFNSTGQNPSGQTITLQNSGAAVDWAVTASTTDGANWLSATPTNGHLNLNATQNVTVNINVASLKPHAYQGTLTFSYGGFTRQIAIALTVSQPLVAAISVSPGTLNFSTIKGLNPAPQPFTLTNTGNAMLNWTTAEDNNGATFAPISPASGSLAPGKSIGITVAPAVAQANGGLLVTHITVSDSDTGTTVRSQSVTANITVKDQAVINLSDSQMTFNHTPTFNDTTNLLVISNVGSASLNWSATISYASGSTGWLTLSETGGTVIANDYTLMNIECNSSALPVGTYTATITIRDTDAGTPVPSQTLSVTVVVSAT